MKLPRDWDLLERRRRGQKKSQHPSWLFSVTSDAFSMPNLPLLLSPEVPLEQWGSKGHSFG